MRNYSVINTHIRLSSLTGSRLVNGLQTAYGQLRVIPAPIPAAELWQGMPLDSTDWFWQISAEEFSSYWCKQACSSGK